jgi:antitoxin MazE
MKIDLIPIGNSQGVRFPKAVIEQAGLTSQLELQVGKGQVILRSINKPRSNWERDAIACQAAGEDRLDDWDVALTDFSGDW